jgi:hypothetical protein
MSVAMRQHIAIRADDVVKLILKDVTTGDWRALGSDGKPVAPPGKLINADEAPESST